MLELEDKQFLVECVQSAFCVGEASETIPAVRDSFPTCLAASSLLEAMAEAAKNATSGDVVLLSPACSSWDQFQNHQHRGEVYC
jgi:UDP-N-acetylmuramoylalanine--D-glutamate ligase